MEVKNEFNKKNIIIIALGLILSLVALFMTKNFLYFIIVGALFLAIYLMINGKTYKIKHRTSLTATISSGIIAALSLFAYFYSKWILPFTINLLKLPALEIATDPNPLDEVASVFLIIGIVFTIISIAFLISNYIIKKKEAKNLVLEEIEKA